MSTLRSEGAFALDAFLAEHGVAARYASSGPEIHLRCPSCGRDKLYLNRNSGLFFCFRCGEKGDLVRFVSLVGGISLGAAKALVGDLERAAAPAPRRREPQPGELEYPKGFRAFGEDLDRQEPYARYLVEARRVPGYALVSYGMGYCDYGYYAGRVVLPVFENGWLAHWVARDITGQALRKVLTPFGGQQSAHLFNLDRVRGLHTVVLTEGVFDALRAPESAVASFGKHLSTRQRGLLLRAEVQDLVVAWDQDAYVDAIRLALDVKLLFGSVRVARLGAKDPSDMTEAQFRDAIKAAGPVTLGDLLRAGRAKIGVA